MRIFALSVLCLLALGAPSAAGADADTVTVTLEVTYGNHLAPAVKSCDVTVPVGSTAADVLDAAQASGCIGSWSGTTYSFGRFVDCIDGLCGQNFADLVGTFWGFYVNERASPVGIDARAVAEGDVVEFAYADWYTGILLP